MHIDDTPRFSWRGLMLDSARHFQSVDEIKRLLDAMALHKLNVFHWHLTDDQGWRIEIRKYPKLTEVGGCRIPAGDAGIDPTTGKPAPYCGYYTQDQIRDVVAYAAARHITIVPEIDVPGHATAAIAAYPRLGLLGEAPAVSNEWGVHANLFNTEESTFRFLEDVFGEVAALFPGEYVHVGGDEAVKDQWIASRHVQQRMKELGAKDEMAMQGLLVARLQKLLAASGKRLIGWDEILEGDLPPSATVMSWRGTEGGIAAANRGHDVVMTPVDTLYLDYLQSDSPDEVPGRPTLSTLKDVYDFEPLPSALPEDRQQHILGLQANAWTEHMRTFDRVQHQVFPRIAALAETGWSPAAKKNYDDFLVRLPAQLRRYDALGIKYAKTPFEEKAVAQGNSRSDEQMALCSRTVPLRLEDDGPFAGERAIFNVDIFNPCWEWKQARLAGIGAVEVRAGRIPYNFQLAHDEEKRSFKPAKSAHGELVVRAGCDGAELANVPLPAQPDADGFVTLQAPIPARSRPADLCVYFTGDTRPAMWVLDRVTLVPKR
ncbi:beta-hexosaminidase [Pseudoxanthomonas sangjuensis]|nr:beta-hexosaminidase [Pseudoxanthomonas sangjuensis]